MNLIGRDAVPRVRLGFPVAEARQRVPTFDFFTSGYTMHTAASGSESLQICEDLNAPVHLVRTDVVMPKMSDRELAERRKEICPELKGLFTSGNTDDAIMHHGMLDPGTHFIAKRFNPAILMRKVRGTLDA